MVAKRYHRAAMIVAVKITEDRSGQVVSLKTEPCGKFYQS
jgi:hypothetical protein